MTARHREAGAPATLAWLVQRLAARVYACERRLVVVRALDDAASAGPDAGLEVRPLEEADPEAVLAFARRHRFPGRSPGAVRFALDHYRGLVGLRDGEPVAFYWWTGAGEEHPDLVLNGIALGEGDAYGFWLFVAPEERSRGTASGFLAAVARQARAEGFRRLLGFVLETNLAARWLFSLSGYEPGPTVPVRLLLGRVALAPAGVFVRRTARGGGPPFGFRPLRRTG